MSWELLPTDYTDATWNGRKKYQLVNNDDSTVSLEDVTVYTNREKSFFGAKDANRMNEALNTIMSMVENGTDLYEAFQIYFQGQKDAFTKKADQTGAELDTYAQGVRQREDKAAEDLESHVDALKTSSSEAVSNLTKEARESVDALTKEGREAVDTLKQGATQSKEDFDTYMEGLKQEGDQEVESLKTDYRAEINQFEGEQERAFNAWYAGVKGQLDGDIAGKLQNEIDNLDAKDDGFVSRQTEFSEDGKTITETFGEKKIITTFEDDGTIVQKLFLGEILKATKTITFSGETIIKEEVS